MINRGNYRRNLFGEAGAAEAFERTLGEAAERFGWRVHAYVVMRNHFHLAVELTEPNLSEGMKWLQGTWIRRYNRYRHLIGRPFQGRYKAILVEPGHVFGQVCHYIHLNPVRAGVVTPEEAAKYPWSSLPKWPERKRPAWLCPVTILAQAGSLPDSKAGWRQYQAYLEFMATDEEMKRELVGKRLSRGWCLGARTFKQEFRKDQAGKGADLDLVRFGGLGPEEVKVEREELWEEKLKALALTARIDLAKLGMRKSAPEKVLLAAALKQSTSVSNGWLSRRLVMGEPASASQFVRRLLLTTRGQAAVRSLLSRVKT
ncbi:transposase [Opitutaceae bacterium]